MKLPTIIKWLCLGIVGGLIAGLFIGFLLFKKDVIVFEGDFFSWWSVVSTLIGIVFLIGNVGQHVALVKEKDLIQKEKEIHKSQVKVWQHYANGIQSALFLLAYKGFNSVPDMKTAVEATQQVANSLYTSLNEERLFTDEEIKEKQLQKEKETKELLKRVETQG